MNAPNTLRELLPAGVLGQELIHESAHLHVTGEAVYTDDIPELRGTLYAALVKSPVAHGELIGEGIDRAALLAEHGVVAVFTARDIPGENNCGPIIHDDPFLADGKVEFLGQAVAVVVAREMLYAREAASRVHHPCPLHRHAARSLADAPSCHARVAARMTSLKRRHSCSTCVPGASPSPGLARRGGATGRAATGAGVLV